MNYECADCKHWWQLSLTSDEGECEVTGDIMPFDHDADNCLHFEKEINEIGD